MFNGLDHCMLDMRNSLIDNIHLTKANIICLYFYKYFDIGRHRSFILNWPDGLYSYCYYFQF